MQTDELRAELADLAREVEEFDGDIARVRRRVAKRRIAMSSLAAVVAVVLVAGVVAISHSRSNKLVVAGLAKDVKVAELRRVQALVVLPSHATAADVARVQGILDETHVVARYAPLSVGSLALALRSTLDAAPSSALFRRVCANPTTRSYAVELSNAGSAPRALKRAIGSSASVVATGRYKIDVELFMAVKATNAEVEAVRARIKADGAVVRSTFLTHQDAYDEFEKIFSDQPTLTTAVSPEDLPESFRLVLRDDASPQAVAREFRGMAGVDAAFANAAQRFAAPGVTLEQACSSKP